MKAQPDESIDDIIDFLNSKKTDQQPESNTGSLMNDLAQVK